MAIFIYPSQSVTASNPSVGLNGDPAPLSSTQVAGNDGTNLVPLSVNSAGALALPQGASTSAKQDIGNASLASIDSKVSTAAKQDVGNASLASIDTKVATAAKQDTGNASLASIDGKVATAAKQDTGNTSLSSIDSKIPANLTVNSTRLLTDGSGVTQPISATALPLPSGAATSAAQTNGTQKTQIVDGTGNVIGSTSNSLNVNVTNSSSGTTLTGVVDANNSSTAPLGIAGVFTGAATDIKDYGTVSVLVASDVAAATGGFSFQFSNNGTNWDHVHNFDFAGGNLSYNISAEARYFRLVYTNGAVAQSYFRLQTVLRPVNVFPSQYTVAQSLTDYSLGTVTKGVIYGKTTGMGGGYVAVKVNPSGALTTENTVVSSVLPTGAATETTLSALNTKVPANLTVTSTRLLVDGSGVTQPVSAASLPLPTGAATETTLSALNQRLGGSLTPVRFDEIALTYVPSGNGAGEVATAVFKLASVTVRTLTLSYDSNNRLTGVVAT